MRTITRATLALTGAAALTLLAVVPANAALSDTDEITVAVPIGEYGISTGTSGTPLEIEGVVPGAAVSATIAGIEVSDLRASETEWIVSASATEFVSTDDAEAETPMSDVAILYTASAPVTEGDPAITVTTAAALTAVGAPVVTAVPAGNNTAIWDAVLSFTVPASTLSGTYTTTVTHSIL